MIPIDASAWAAPAVAAAVGIASASAGRVQVVHVRAWQPASPPSREEGGFLSGHVEVFTETPEQAVDLIEVVQRKLRDKGLGAQGIVVEAPRSMVGTVLANVARAWHADLIVLCRRPRRPIGIWLLGSVSEQVMREASCPVLVVRPSQMSAKWKCGTVRERS